MSEPVAGSESAIAATLTWPFSSVPFIRRRNSSFCSSVPMRATGEHARPEPPSASAMPAQPHAISSEPTTDEPRLRLRLLRIGILVDAGQLLAAVEQQRSATGRSAWACFIRSHGIDSSRSCLIAIGRIDCFANAPIIWRVALEHRVVVEEIHAYCARLLREDAAEPLVAEQRLEGARVAHELLDRIIVDEAVAAEDLDGVDRRARDAVAGDHARAARGVGGVADGP